ncbi:MAG: hypothetical protein LBL31_04585, partial [Spirochaetaceae bacterium]|nr:hypothetical protein [Spirochaetaceae bacterium]
MVDDGGGWQVMTDRWKMISERCQFISSLCLSLIFLINLIFPIYLIFILFTNPASSLAGRAPPCGGIARPKG